jgi:DNA-binding CsgD family transcriptional regulator
MPRTTVDGAALRSLVESLNRPVQRQPTGSPVAVDPAVLRILAQLVPADIVVFNDMGPRRRVDWAGSDSEGDIGGYCAWEDGDPFFDIFWSSPCSYPDRSGDWESPTLLSDFCTVREWRRSPMYDEISSYFAYDRELLLPMRGPAGHSRRIRFLRAGGADFDETDRSLAAFVRPHLVAHLHALDLAAHGVVPLTARQSQLVSLLAEGLTNSQIGRTLGISSQTVRTHLQQVYARLGVSSRGEAVALLSPPGPTPPLFVDGRPGPRQLAVPHDLHRH